MSHIAEEILNLYPVRKTAEQKREFRGWLKRYLERSGYSVKEEKSGRSVNVVVGDPTVAKYVISANYDTAARSVFPGFASVTNPVFFIIYQVLIAALQIIACFLAALGVTFVLDAPGAAFPLFCLLVFLLICLSLYGPANRHNANANTSGLATVLEIAKGLTKEARDDVVFVFFDNGECGMTGSTAYRKQHKRDAAEQVVFHFYACGDGDELLLVPNNRERWDEVTVGKLEKHVLPSETKRVKIVDKGLVYYLADQRRFRFSFLVGAFHHKKALGYFQAKLRTNKDTVCDGENIALLSRGFIKFIEE